jgi:hypothetical protein
MVEFSILQSTRASVVALVLFAFLVGFYVLGYRLNKARHKVDDPNQDLSAINTALLGLLALLLAFTFGMSNSRFDTRRKLMIDEANSISTALLRTDVYPDSMRHVLRGHLKEYLEARIAYFEAGMDEDEILKQHIRTGKVADELWAAAVAHAKVDDITARTSELLLVLTPMIDLITERRASVESTIPDSIMYFLFVLCIGSSFLLGYDNRNKFDWVVIIGFALMLSATVFTIIDLDRSRSGLIRMDSFNQKFIELREMFKETDTLTTKSSL